MPTTFSAHAETSRDDKKTWNGGRDSHNARLLLLQRAALCKSRHEQPARRLGLRRFAAGDQCSRCRPGTGTCAGDGDAARLEQGRGKTPLSRAAPMPALASGAEVRRPRTSLINE
jgi:hypothetical protein